MRTAFEREKVYFQSGDAECAAWHYPGSNGACVVMAPGLAVPKEPATDPFAKPFHDAGFSVLAFDFRRFGEGGGEPRQLLDISGQQADMAAALDFASALPGVDAAKVALWGFSLAGGHVLAIASQRPELAAAIAVSANADGRAASRNALPHQTPWMIARLAGVAVWDSIAARLGRPPRLVALTGERGTLAMTTAPDALNADRALNPGDRYPEWCQQLAARSLLGLGSYRPARRAREIRCPLLVLAYEQDDAALAAPAIRAGEAAPLGEVYRAPGGHYEPYMDGYERAVEVQLEFLRRQVLGDGRAGRAAVLGVAAG
jgi:pimeloyl-ACP methyl ester carboxylesterase